MWHNILGRTFLDNTVENILWFFGIILIGLILKTAIAKVLTAFVFRFLKKYSTGVRSEKLFLLLKKPLDVFIILITFFIAFQYIDFPLSWKMMPKERFGVQMVIYKFYEAAIIFSVTWMILRLIDFFGLIMLHKASKTISRADDQLVHFLKESIKVIIFIFSIFFILGTIFNLNVATLIGGLGIGGLAVALAAKESLENLIGSFTIFLDKPFVIGDHVEIGKISGHVEQIGFRSTRIRTLEKSFVTVPNKKMVEAELNNISMRTYRTVKFNVGITYLTPPEKIRLIVSDIQLFLDGHPLLYHEESKARFLEFGANSLNIMIQYFMNVVDWQTYINTREEINLKIIDIVKRHKSGFVYPPNTLVSEKSEDEPQ